MALSQEVGSEEHDRVKNGMVSAALSLASICSLKSTGEQEHRVLCVTSSKPAVDLNSSSFLARGLLPLNVWTSCSVVWSIFRDHGLGTKALDDDVHSATP